MVAPRLIKSASTCLVALALGLIAPLDLAAAEPDGAVRIALDRSARSPRVEVRGLAAEQLAGIQPLVQDRGRMKDVFAVFAGVGTDESRPAMLGSYVLDEGVLAFQPRFPFKPGLTYTAVFRPSAIPGAASATNPVRQAFRIPEPDPAEPTRVEHVYPSRNRLPENQLKFYLHFSAPMSQGESYRYIHLIEGEGHEVEFPFLELGEELWNERGTRLTVFFDPGRIKRGLKPREDVGPSLEEGKRYTLLIDGEWPDASGRPLQDSFRKEFQVVAPDDEQPNPERWTIAPPAAGTGRPLVVEFDEPLDHAMLQRVLRVRNARGEPVAGRIEIDRKETRWRFHPEQPWKAGRYSLLVETTLEDLAGNSIGRPFEVDVFRPVERQVQPRDLSIPFEAADGP